MTTNEDLGNIVDEFREAEGALRDIVDRANELHTAAAALEATRDNIWQASEAVAEGGKALEASSLQLGTIAAQLASTTEALEKTDPEGVLREISRLGDQVERLRSRIDETNAEQRTRIETAEKTFQRELDDVAHSLADTSDSIGEQLNGLARSVKTNSIIMIGLLVIVVVLIVLQRVAP